MTHTLAAITPRPVFTKRHYRMLATVLESERPTSYTATPATRTQWEQGTVDLWHTAVLNVATMLGIDNPSFDRLEFYKACMATTLVADYYRANPASGPQSS